MQDLQDTPTTAHPVLTGREVARWSVTFLGYPLGGFAALLAVGRVDSAQTAVVGGLLTGLVLGAVQAWGLGRNRPHVVAWTFATAVGFAVGLGLGASLVDFDTSLTALVTQGAFTGLTVGAAQALVLLPRLGVLAAVWVPALGVIWAAGWTVTTAAGIGVDDQFTVFGSSGALVVTALTLVLPFALNRRNP
jgi:hypothetical protein